MKAAMSEGELTELEQLYRTYPWVGRLAAEVRQLRTSHTNAVEFGKALDAELEEFYVHYNNCACTCHS